MELGQKSLTKYPPFLLGYELHAPELAVDDLVGSLRLEVALPEPAYGNQGRIRDSRISDFRIVDGSVYNNFADVLGIQVQRRQGDGSWQPLPQAGNPIGLMASGGNGQTIKVTVEDVSEWQTYEFRARLVAVATGPLPLARHLWAMKCWCSLVNRPCRRPPVYGKSWMPFLGRAYRYLSQPPSAVVMFSSPNCAGCRQISLRPQWVAPVSAIWVLGLNRLLNWWARPSVLLSCVGVATHRPGTAPTGSLRTYPSGQRKMVADG